MVDVISVCIFKKTSKLVNFCAAILILNMEEATFQHIMLYYFKKGKNTTEMQKKKKICAVYGEGAVAHGTCQKWFAKVLCAIGLLAK